ncbi:MAG: hypothetical protein UY83_C0009G0010 [Candidatus Adlerbacteria bacterium GW2011_GWA1_54_10]|uniref:Uncharacterized protein n=2 Tax=Candidatus Adleribacteriota TaxID=1752736 RepID=A0A0G2A3E9_9BACT|nr:MAG: hypothetical protein UY83_C0009G0010 [Candidatus Adlerbacteria bacterium GW2011_GWA1_54_10]KKW38060.1 MAG: hypothetical protein UY86_C0001G0033 [Candidatus Adlerbacteria bacterium GW2011_GWB1_54_7]
MKNKSKSDLLPRGFASGELEESQKELEEKMRKEFEERCARTRGDLANR